MGGPSWPPSRFWQYWAIAGMIVLTAAFWWAAQNYALFQGIRPRSQFTDGFLRFSILVLTPSLVVTWAAAAWLKRRIGETGYWKFLGAVAAIWLAALLILQVLPA